ncbi:hypothetical protein [Nonomuraea sp. NEAU-A123]|uniref:hypothetical protein n=1 Tax=Nonomuraea sp. NEAU-A123 TaxID=2839649 RepID=UPI001BE44395|nr:hypothetical protein [Nonomuraea sp. NEAU-A123]MBT2233469.1 hypothetical protein [Nonomuraea sp. NEAU-A123]
MPLGLHPQAAYEQHPGAAEDLRPPALQRPQLAVVCTAGLLAEHGIDMADLGDDHSLTQDPTVARLRAAAELLDEDLWIAVRPPATTKAPTTSMTAPPPNAGGPW